MAVENLTAVKSGWQDFNMDSHISQDFKTLYPSNPASCSFPVAGLQQHFLPIICVNLIKLWPACVSEAHSHQRTAMLGGRVTGR